MSAGGDAEGGASKSISTQLMQNPELLAALQVLCHFCLHFWHYFCQSKLDGLTGMNSDYIRSLPPDVKRRIRALKKLQETHMNTEIEFHKEFHLLELKYQHKMAELAKKVTFLKRKIHPYFLSFFEILVGPFLSIKICQQIWDILYIIYIYKYMVII